MGKEFFYLILCVIFGLLILYGLYLNKKREKLPILKPIENHKLLFNNDEKTKLHKINITPEKIINMVSSMAGINNKPPEIYYWEFIKNTEIVGISFLIRQAEEAAQFEMNYNEFLKITDDIIEESKDIEKSLTEYFEQISKNVKLISIQFEELLVKNDVQYEKIEGV